MTNSADPDQLASSDLDLHSLLRQDMSCSAREGLSIGTDRPEQTEQLPHLSISD